VFGKGIALIGRISIQGRRMLWRGEGGEGDKQTNVSGVIVIGVGGQYRENVRIKIV
jgi:hypothetical protein